MKRSLIGAERPAFNSDELDLIGKAIRTIEAKYLVKTDALTSPEVTGRYFKLRLAGVPYEVFSALFLDNRHHAIEYVELFRGTVDGASVHPREVARKAITCNAAAVVFAHNHPSGFSEPSQADISITRRLTDALALIDVRVLDHFIIGDGEPSSLAERGLI